jgi:DNA-directed RNA polymerase beta subunit
MTLAMSDIIKKGIIFPQFISTKRILMMSSILKQCSKLGWNGQYDEDQLIESEEGLDIPKLHGRNVLVGVLDWNLYTHEDSCVISESLANKLITYKNITEIVEHVIKPNLLVKTGDVIKPHTPLGSVNIDKEVKVFYSSNNVDSIIDSISFETELIENQIINRFKINLIAEYKCTIGSKVSNLHSVKNIISAIIPDDRMPVMQDGTNIEIMISPTSIGNRKNPSMILECMLGMYLRELSFLHKIPTPNLIINQFNKEINFKLAADMLLSVGLPENCMFRLKNGTRGHVFKYSTLVGYTFLMRLHHHAEDKAKYSDKINYDHRGFAQLGIGSQRLNRDEMEILWANNSQGIIKEAIELNKKTTICDTIQEYVKCIGYKYV